MFVIFFWELENLDHPETKFADSSLSKINRILHWMNIFCITFFFFFFFCSVMIKLYCHSLYYQDNLSKLKNIYEINNIAK